MIQRLADKGPWALAISAWLFVIAIIVQVLYAGLSTFGQPRFWVDHVSFGRMIGTLPILILLFALISHRSKLTIALAVGVFFAYGLQFPLAMSESTNVAAIHVVNALLLFWLTTQIAQRSTATVRAGV